MAAHRHIDGVYQWELSIPPASAMALLSAACVKLENSKPSIWDQVGAPRCWGIYFEGYQFGLFPLHRGKLYTIFGLPRGTIVPTKAGCRIELRHDNNQFERYGLMAFAVLLPATVGPIVVIPALSSFAFLTRITASAAIVGWCAVWFVWLIPWMARLCYRDFLDDLVADYVVQPAVEKKLSSRANVTAAAK